MAEESMEKFRSLHDEAYLYINQAITQEKPEINRLDVALMMYQRGLGLIDQALCFDTEGTDQQFVKARKMQGKMEKTRSHVESRIHDITNILAPPVHRTDSRSPVPPGRPSAPPNPPCRPPPPGSALPTAPPTYHEATRGPTNPPTYDQVRSGHTMEAMVEPATSRCGIGAVTNTSSASGGGAVTNTSSASGIKNSDSNGSLSEQGQIVFTMPLVQIFRISVSGEVTTPSYPDTLEIIKFTRDHHSAQLPPAFIQVGDWSYPLIPGRSPVLKSTYGGYMFPDLEDCAKGASVGLLFHESIEQSERDLLESILTELTTSFKTEEELNQEYIEYQEFSQTVSAGLLKGAEMMGAGMVKGAVKTSELLFTGADYAKTYIKPENPRPVDPRVVKGLEVARMVSSGACKVSGWMVSKVGSATLALGRMAAPHLERGASKAITHFSGQSSVESNHQLKIVGEVASGSLAAVSTLYIALENSSKILAKNMANNTVMIVSHKYGTDAAAVADAAFATAGNSYLTFYNTAALGPKSIAKRAAKDAGKAVVGFDAVATKERAERAPDLKIGAEDVLQTFQPDKQEKPPPPRGQ